MINWIGRTEIYGLRSIERLGGIIVNSVDEISEVIEEIAHVVADEICELTKLHPGGKRVNVYAACAVAVERTGQADSVDVRIEVRDGDAADKPNTTFLCLTVTDLDTRRGAPNSDLGKVRARACGQRLGELLSLQLAKLIDSSRKHASLFVGNGWDRELRELVPGSADRMRFRTPAAMEAFFDPYAPTDPRQR